MAFVARDLELKSTSQTACSCYVHPVVRWDQQDPDPVVYRPWRYRGLGGAISSLAVNQTNENRPIVFLSQKTDGDKPDKNRIIYIPLPMYEKTYEIFASADGNGLWDLSPCAVSFGNNTKLLIRAEQNGRMMLYHLQLRECDRLRPEALRLVDPWGFGSITHAAPVRSDPAIITPPPERFGSGTHATTVRADERILIAHSCAGEPPAWYIFDLAAPTEPPEIVSASQSWLLSVACNRLLLPWGLTKEARPRSGPGKCARGWK